jgi:hypothetical protein
MRISPPFLPTFFFLPLKLRTICYKKQEKKVRKNFVLLVNNFVKKIIFLSLAIFYRVFFGGGQFLLFLKPYSDRSVSTLHRFKKSEGVMGRLFYLFSLRRISFGFSKNPCARSILHIRPHTPPVIGGPMS